MSPRASENSYQYNVHRALSTAVRTFLVVLAAGAALSFTERPTYRCTAKLFLENGNGQQTIVDASIPLSGLFGTSSYTNADQIEIMKGDKVFSDACKDADVPPDAVTMDVHQVPGTSVVEIVVDGSTPTYVERFAKTIPNTYDSYVTGNRRSEISNAYTFANYRLKEENDKLVESEIAQENFLVQAAKMAPTPPYARRMREMQRVVDLHRSTVDLLTKSIEDLRLRSKMTHDPVLVISPAKHAQQISTTREQYLLNSAILGLILGLFAAGIHFLLRQPKRA
jgi:uncharacterized protein involved in exopolysaccharide biosynthesis